MYGSQLTVEPSIGRYACTDMEITAAILYKLGHQVFNHHGHGTLSGWLDSRDIQASRHGARRRSCCR